MEKDRLEQFFKKMANDKAIQEKVQSFNGNTDALAAYATELGYDISAEDLRTYTNDALKMLKAKLQNKVAGPQATKSPGATAFFSLVELAETDENVKARLDELAEGTPEELIAYGAEKGFVFTEQDMLDIGKDILEPADELSDEELELVAGGTSAAVIAACVFILAGSAVVGALAGGVVVGAGVTGAAVGFILAFTALSKK